MTKVKCSLYPKTSRHGKIDTSVIVTEKIDGSNLGLFKFDGKLYIAQRNWVIPIDQLDAITYKGLRAWLEQYGEHLQDNLQEGACIFGEWVGMGKLKYPEDWPRFQQFAKCNVMHLDGLWQPKNLYYDRQLFKWSYVEQKQPEYITSVPLVATRDSIPTIDELDQHYDWYINTEGRDVEGFIVILNNTVSKYVRYKNGKQTPHHTR